MIEEYVEFVRVPSSQTTGKHDWNCRCDRIVGAHQTSSEPLFLDHNGHQFKQLTALLVAFTKRCRVKYLFPYVQIMLIQVRRCQYHPHRFENGMMSASKNSHHTSDLRNIRLFDQDAWWTKGAITHLPHQFFCVHIYIHVNSIYKYAHIQAFTLFYYLISNHTGCNEQPVPQHCCSQKALFEVVGFSSCYSSFCTCMYLSINAFQLVRLHCKTTVHLTKAKWFLLVRFNITVIIRMLLPS